MAERSERLQRQIDLLLDQAEEAIPRHDWAAVRKNAEAVLRVDPQNPDALAYLAMAPDQPEHSTVDPPAAPLTATASPAHPTSFASGRYRVVRFLGEGATKRVYQAHDLQLDRDVAFALIKSDGLDADGLARIRREAQAMGRLGDHPHIVTVHDIGETDGQPYIVSQYMAGGSLQALIEQEEDHRLRLDQTLNVADQVCQALEHAHVNGVIHRDLKPGNVWLMRGSGFGVQGSGDGVLGGSSSPPTPNPQTPTPIVAKLGDFGLAMALDRSRLTQAGMMVGTVAYMSPEQALGGEVTARSDLYSLGALLYELVTGRPPFVGDESVAIITQHLNTPPVSPSWHAPDVPPGLETLILRLLEKDPTKRPGSAAEVRRALGGLRGQGSGVGRAASLRVEPLSPDTQNLTPAPADPTYQRTFVGREAELRQLQRAFDTALSGRGSLAMVVGEPGIGKTSVCEQLATYAAVRSGKALVGHCYEEGSLSIPYLPFVEAMRTYVLDHEPEKLKAELGSGAGEVARIISEIRDRVQVELPAAGDPDDDRWRLLQAVTSFLRNASQVQPLLIVLEDLHDSDKGTLDLLLHLSRNLQGARLLIVGTYRDVEVDRTHPLSGTLAELRRSANFLRVPLRGLTVEEVQRMISNIRGQEVAWSRAELYHRQTEGNPLFVQEVLRYLVEEGLVIREGGRYALADSGAADAGIPEGLRDVIGKRLSRLSEKANQALSIASVIGRDFRLDVLQRVAGLPEEELIEALEEAEERAVIEERPGPAGVPSFRFTHAFFRQTLYDEIFAARRIRWHQQVARALEEIHARRLEEHAVELAEHFAYSSNPDDLQKAVHYGQLAAQRAMSVNAYGEAAHHLEQALKALDVLDPDDQTQRCDLLLALGEALMPVGEPQRAYEEAAEAAFELAEALGDGDRMSRACVVAIEALHRATQGGGASYGSAAYRAWADRADRHAEPGSRTRVFADIALGSIQLAQGNPREERAFSARALELARELGDPQALFEAVQRMLRGSYAPKGWPEQLALADEFATGSRDGVSTRPLGLVLERAAVVLLAGGERARAEALWSEVEELAKRTGDAEAQLWPIQTEVLRATLDGDLEAAVEAAVLAAGRAEVAGRSPARSLSVVPLLYLGRAEEALGWPLSGPQISALYGLCLAHAGHGDAARLEVARLLDPAAPLAQDGADAGALGHLLEIAVLTRDADRAAGLAPRLDGLTATTSGGSLVVHAVGRHLGGAATLLGDGVAARAHYTRALDWATKIRHRPEIALTRLQLAELLLEHFPNEHAEAVEHLDFAVKEFEAMKMAPSLERGLALQTRLEG